MTTFEMDHVLQRYQIARATTAHTLTYAERARMRRDKDTRAIPEGCAIGLALWVIVYTILTIAGN